MEKAINILKEWVENNKNKSNCVVGPKTIAEVEAAIYFLEGKDKELYALDLLKEAEENENRLFMLLNRTIKKVKK